MALQVIGKISFGFSFPLSFLGFTCLVSSFRNWLGLAFLFYIYIYIHESSDTKGGRGVEAQLI
jgi:hypothetical protein